MTSSALKTVDLKDSRTRSVLIFETIRKLKELFLGISLGIGNEIIPSRFPTLWIVVESSEPSLKILRLADLGLKILGGELSKMGLRLANYLPTNCYF